jgi:hypothetical protein
VKITSSNSPLNILQVKDFQEVFFGVFEVQINENKYVAEKISEENGNPIVSILVEEGNEKAQYPFLLLKGKQEIYFNSESEPVEIFESNIENEEDEDLDVKELIEENFDNSEIIEDKKQEILEEIKRVKRNAVKKSLEILEHNKAKNIQDIKNESRKKEKALKGYLESARENLVDEFTIISGKIKNELISDNDYKFDEIRESIDLKIQDIADNLNESLGKNFQNSSKLIDKSVKQLVKELYESNINPKVDKELKDIAEEIVEKVSEIDKNLNNKLDEKADVSLIEGVNRELDAIRDANIELNNSLNKGVQKALSRVGNVDKKILEISEKFDNKISETEQEITQYFDEKLSLVKEETLDITDEARKYFQNLIQENRNGLLSEIRKIKNEKPVEYILESNTGKPIVKDWDSIEKDWNKKIHDKFENYKTDLRKYVAVYASGGGTNATQYQDGGTMYGDLTIIGKLSAGEYLGIRTDYLPLSGGTITGDVTVTGLLSAERIYTTQLDALSANITVIDIKQYELSGFNVTGNVTINGTVSAGNLSAGEIYSNGNRVATVVDPVRTTVTGNGTLSTFPISGASGLVNPSALIVAIDGILQEPVVDYTVASGNITFTSPLPSGSKAVVISPTNSLQVSQNIPADGSVTSAKIAGGVTLTDPIINNSIALNATSYVYGSGAATAHKTSLGFKNIFAVSDESKTPNNTNYADDSELFLTLEAGTWLIKSNAFWSNADNTVGVRAQVAFSGTMDITKSPIIAHVGSSNDSNNITLASTSSRPVGALTSTMPRVLIAATAARNGIIQIEHTVSVSVAGVYSLQWGQGTASPTLATIRKAGSFITATKLN